MCVKQYVFAVFSRDMMGLCEAAADTLCFTPPVTSILWYRWKRDHKHTYPQIPAFTFYFPLKWSSIVKRYRTRKGEVSSAFVENQTGRKDRD